MQLQLCVDQSNGKYQKAIRIKSSESFAEQVIDYSTRMSFITNFLSRSIETREQNLMDSIVKGDENSRNVNRITLVVKDTKLRISLCHDENL